MADKEEKPNIYSNCDERLLISGILSDVKVICGDKTWNLHKTIICIRCPYFEKPLWAIMM
ncbi:Uu.00g037160.m01.CDS01 [Anthostomella pinea]|uniref:Uu.00g037160.m01.CDS01 n=1 Tax=Anthostomella pinea TaxID=933095 RepID=A0AAI8V9P1_9PEZI|nr:Uu.00g037160.m01.CDS01 [Anthostomella pinea]